MKRESFTWSRHESLAIPSQRDFSDPATGRRKRWFHIFSARGKSRPFVVKRGQAVQA